MHRISISNAAIGITYMKGRGGYTGVEKDIIYCVISRLELAKLKQLVKTVDPTAFIAIETVHEVEGVKIKEKRAKRSFTKKLLRKLKK